MPRLLLIWLLFSIAVSPAFAQPKVGQARVDSLLAELPRAKPDTNHVNLLNRISSGLYSINPNEGINYASQALALARQLTWKKGMVDAYRILGNYYSSKSDYPQALTSYLIGLKIAEEIKDKDRIMGITGNMGIIHVNLANYPQALANYEKALKGSEELGDKGGVVI